MPNSGFVAIAASQFHSLGLKSDGSIAAWGASYSGRNNVPPPNTGFVAIAEGPFHSLALRADGSISAWGDNQYGQCNVPLPNAGFIALDGGSRHTVGLKSDGSIVVWGECASNYPLCEVPPPNAGFVGIAAAGNLNFALNPDGSIVVMGQIVRSPYDVPDTNCGFAAISSSDGLQLGLRRRIEPNMVSAAVSRGACDLNLNLCRPVTSESRLGGIKQLRVTFDTPPANGGSNSATIEESRCSSPGIYAPYSGSASVSAHVERDELVLTFDPALENGRTYRLTFGPEVTPITGQFVEVRALRGDVNSDGLVDALDRSLVVASWKEVGFTCMTDVNHDGRSDGLDRSIVVGAWTSPQNCAP